MDSEHAMIASPVKLRRIREKVSAEEWQARMPAAACYRLMALYGMTDMIAVTAREFLDG